MKLLAGSSSPMAIMMVVSAGVMWAGSGLGAQNVYEKSSINAMELTAFRMIMAGIILLGMTVWEGKFKSSMKAMNEHKLLWPDVLIYAVVGLMLMHYTYFEAIAYGDAPTATVILYSCPAMVVCYQAIREHHLPSETKMFTTFLAVFGTFLLVTGGNPATLNVSVICILLSLLNGVIYSFASIYPKHLFLKINRTFILGVGMILGGLVSWAFVPDMNLAAFFEPDIIVGVMWIVLFGTVAAFLLYNTGLMYLSPEQALITAASEPIASVLMSWAFFQMSFDMIQSLGIMMVVMAIIAPAYTGKHSPFLRVRKQGNTI